MAEFERIYFRDKLLCVEPALSQSDIIPVMSHFWFTGRSVMAYNDRIAISVPLQTAFQGAVPRMLAQLVNTSPAPNVELTPSDDEVAVKLASSRIKLAMLSASEFCFEMPDHAADATPVKGSKFYDGIRCCLASVGNDPSVPEQMGVTLMPDGDALQLFATNNLTMSHARVSFKGLKLKRRVILSTDFCNQMLRLSDDTDAKACSLYIADEYAQFIAGKVTLFGLLVQSPKPLDFPAMLEFHFSAPDRKRLCDVPTKLAPIIERSIIMTQGKHDAQRISVTAAPHPSNSNVIVLTFKTESAVGAVTDAMQTDKRHGKAAIMLEPKLVRAGLGTYKQFLFTDKCLVMANEDASHLYMVTAVDG